MTEASFLLRPPSPPQEINKQSPMGLVPWAKGGKSGSHPQGMVWGGRRWAQDHKGPAGQKGLFPQSWGPDSVEGKSLNLPKEGTEPAPQFPVWLACSRIHPWVLSPPQKTRASVPLGA